MSLIKWRSWETFTHRLLYNKSLPLLAIRKYYAHFWDVEAIDIYTLEMIKKTKKKKVYKQTIVMNITVVYCPQVAVNGKNM